MDNLKKVFEFLKQLDSNEDNIKFVYNDEVDLSTFKKADLNAKNAFDDKQQNAAGITITWKCSVNSKSKGSSESDLRNFTTKNSSKFNGTPL
ncbi:hypothetical protein EI74_0353 [Mycoplasma testudineum]|uniref:Uncharacterized protein n=1 Tax=Mycoplasma testudineum TaxID=244584 RepID=A0A4R6IFP3_9MOLU|nr:hypothetical protein [Mycoplasma testudineum]OYD26972.1 hypothetical protein CG473_01390 [Mycoplasma testudineum]TDO20518.1 hypothetical protein EI74_0353 [Mycoplasma testudineum]